MYLSSNTLNEFPVDLQQIVTLGFFSEILILYELVAHILVSDSICSHGCKISVAKILLDDTLKILVVKNHRPKTHRNLGFQ